MREHSVLAAYPRFSPDSGRRRRAILGPLRRFVILTSPHPMGGLHPRRATRLGVIHGVYKKDHTPRPPHRYSILRRLQVRRQTNPNLRELILLGALRTFVDISGYSNICLTARSIHTCCLTCSLSQKDYYVASHFHGLVFKIILRTYLEVLI